MRKSSTGDLNLLNKETRPAVIVSALWKFPKIEPEKSKSSQLMAESNREFLFGLVTAR